MQRDRNRIWLDENFNPNSEKNGRHELQFFEPFESVVYCRLDIVPVRKRLKQMFSAVISPTSLTKLQINLPHLN